MSQVIKIRLKGYGDNGLMREVAEIEVPQGFALIESMKIVTVPGKPYLLESADMKFDTRPVA